MMIRFLRVSLFILMSCVWLSKSAFATAENKLNNTSFEDDLGGGGNWDQTANRGILNPDLADAPLGSRVLRLSEPAITAPENFTFTFQTVSGVNPGDIVSFGGLAREVLSAGISTVTEDDVGQFRIEFQNSAGTFINDSIVNVDTGNTGLFQRFVTSATAPAGTAQVTFTIRIQNASRTDVADVTSIIDFDDVVGTINGDPIFLGASSSSSSGSAGDTAIVAVNVRNLTAVAQNGLELVAEAQDGIQIVSDGGALDSNPVSSREGSVIFSLGNIAAGQESVFTFPVVLTSGIVPGKSYELRLFAQIANASVSGTIRLLFRAELDPLFDEGTIIGKVFHDRNANGVQEGCVIEGTAENCTLQEEGVPWVRLVTEEGIVVITDEKGRYHIPGVKPGRHIVKIDGRTLPEGTKFITEESYLVRTTPGILSKANFAVQLPASSIPKQYQKELLVSVTQGIDTSRPKLGVQMDPEIVKIAIGRLEREVAFRFITNYADFIKNWRIEIRDELGREVWTGYGVKAPPNEVVWNGQTERGTLIKPGLYSYQFKVEDGQGYQDWTALHFFKVISKSDPKHKEKAPLDIPSIGHFHVFRDGKSSIPLVAKPTIRVQGKTKPGYAVSINSRPVEVDEAGGFHTQMYATPGEKEVVVQATSSQGETTSYKKKIKVKESTFFMVALAEEQLGINFQDGNKQTFAEEELLEDGFYEDGRLSYYLRGKLKGKFLIQSHYDTDEKRSALFTNLDPDDYYPIYGDTSQRDYSAQDTRDRFYLLIEMDRSYVKWGSFETGFNDTELASFNRTLSGLKVYFETLGNTVYGDPKRSLKLFYSKTKHRADHNEFVATGGSLYYLRNRRVIEGSEKLRVEVRDKIQDITISSYDLTEGKDYEIDYEEGRILLSRPLSSVAASNTLVSNDLLDGNPVFLVVDYEYDFGMNAFSDASRGLRGYTHMGDHIRVGATLVEEKRQNGDYDLRAVDARIKLGRNTQITAEYSETKLKQTGQAISFNGGLSFANLELLRGENTRPRENAYLIKAESKPVKNLELSGYLQGVEPGFSTDRIRSQEGTKKFGVHARYKFHDTLQARYRYDSNKIADQLLPLGNNDLVAAYERINTHTFQAIYDDGKWLGEVEYRIQGQSFPEVSQLQNSLLSEFSFEQGMAAKVGYRVNERLLPYVKVQTAFRNDENHQFGGGLRYEVVKDLFAYMEQMFGNFGDSTYFGFEKHHKNGGRSYANFRMAERGIGEKTLASSIGSSFALTENSRIFTEREHSTYQGVDGFADIIGFDGKAGDNWDVQAKFERRHLEGGRSLPIEAFSALGTARNNSSNVASVAVAYAKGDKFRARSMVEGHFDRGSPKLRQWITRNSVQYQINQDLSFLGKLDFGNSRFLSPSDDVANFMEFSTGFAYRPVEHDKLNALVRYNYLQDVGSDVQFSQPLFGGVQADEKAHIFAVDLAYQIHKYLELVEKFAYKNSILTTNVANEIILHNILWVNRLNFHVTRKWDLAVEYRALWQFDAARTMKHGALIEVDREFYDYVRVGLGYNFTDFDDDIRKANEFDSHGPFVRLTGKF